MIDIQTAPAPTSTPPSRRRRIAFAAVGVVAGVAAVGAAVGGAQREASADAPASRQLAQAAARVIAALADAAPLDAEPEARAEVEAAIAAQTLPALAPEARRLGQAFLGGVADWRRLAERRRRVERRLGAAALDPGDPLAIPEALALALAETEADGARLLRQARARAADLALLAERERVEVEAGAQADRRAARLLTLLAGLAAALSVFALARAAFPSAGARPRVARPRVARPRVARPRADAAPRVLLAEDEPMTRAVTAALLGREGCRVTLAADGLQALEAVRAADFDLVLLDLRMPVMDGLAALAAIRAERDPARPSPVLALLTASSTPAEWARARAAGADGVLAKPLRPGAVADLLRGQNPVASAPPAALDAPVLDPAMLATMEEMLTPERVSILLAGAVTALADYRERLRAARAAEDDGAIKALAHKVAGVAGVYGCPALSRAAQALERGEGVKAELWKRLDGAFPPALDALERRRVTLLRLGPSQPPDPPPPDRRSLALAAR